MKAPLSNNAVAENGGSLNFSTRCLQKAIISHNFMDRGGNTLISSAEYEKTCKWNSFYGTQCISLFQLLFNVISLIISYTYG